MKGEGRKGGAGEHEPDLRERLLQGDPEALGEIHRMAAAPLVRGAGDANVENAAQEAVAAVLRCAEG